MSKKTFEIACTWSSYGTAFVEADSLDEAIDLLSEMPLPCGTFMKGSFEIDYETTDHLNEKGDN